MKRLMLVLLTAVGPSLLGCASPEDIAREREWERQGAIACTARGGVWYSPPGYRGECLSAQEARRREGEEKRRERDRRAEEAREKERRHEKEVACISAGGTWFATHDQCNPGTREIRIIR